MVSENKFLKGMVVGAMVGGAITLLDKDVRKQLLEGGKKKGTQIVEALRHSRETFNEIQDKIESIRTTYKDVNNDLQFILDKASEIKEMSLTKHNNVDGANTNKKEFTSTAYEKGSTTR